MRVGRPVIVHSGRTEGRPGGSATTPLRRPITDACDTLRWFNLTKPGKEEIEGLRREAKERLRSVAKAVRVAEIENRKLEAMQTLCDALVEQRAFELGVSADELSLDDVFATDDTRALLRLQRDAAISAGIAESIVRTHSENDPIDRVIAALAAERGWTAMDAARAILGDGGAKADSVRDTPAHQKARRVREAVEVATRARLERVERQLTALDTGKPSSAAPSLLVSALLGLVTGRALAIDDVRRALEAERHRLANVLQRRQERRGRSS